MRKAIETLCVRWLFRCTSSDFCKTEAAEKFEMRRNLVSPLGLFAAHAALSISGSFFTAERRRYNGSALLSRFYISDTGCCTAEKYRMPASQHTPFCFSYSWQASRLPGSTGTAACCSIITSLPKRKDCHANDQRNHPEKVREWYQKSAAVKHSGAVAVDCRCAGERGGGAVQPASET